MHAGVCERLFILCEQIYTCECEYARKIYLCLFSENDWRRL